MKSDQILNNCVHTFIDRLKKDGIGEYASRPSTLMLYHYTTAEGLKGIIQQDKIWATNFRYVNDRTEFLYANSILESELRSRLPTKRKLIDAVFDAILQTDDLLVGAVDIFIACFCEKGDLLSQWRGYGGRGGGYAIGLGDIKLELPHAGFNYGIYQVNYDESQQKTLIKFLIDEFCTAVEQLGKGIKPASVEPPIIYSELPARDPKKPPAPLIIKSKAPEPLGELCKRLSFAFLEVACCFKNPLFHIEEEWRLVHKRYSESKAAPDSVEFRTSGATLIPYVALPLSTKAHPRLGGDNSRWNFSLEEIV